LTITGAGTTLKDVFVTGVIAVKANNVTIEDVTVADPFPYFSSIGIGMYHASNTVIEYSKVYGTCGGTVTAPAECGNAPISPPSGATPNHYRIQVAVKDVTGDSVSTDLFYDNLFNSSGGTSIASGYVEDSYIHDLGYDCSNGIIDDAHCDHIDNVYSGFGTSTGLVVYGNTLLNNQSQTGAIALYNVFGAQYNDYIYGNLVAGGGTCVYGGWGDHGQNTSGNYNILFENNRFSSLYAPDCGSFQNSAYVDPNANDTAHNNIWSGNFWDTTGATVNPNT
jgi:hypothetical protein